MVRVIRVLLQAFSPSVSQSSWIWAGVFPPTSTPSTLVPFNTVSRVAATPHTAAQAATSTPAVIPPMSRASLPVFFFSAGLAAVF